MLVKQCSKLSSQVELHQSFATNVRQSLRCFKNGPNLLDDRLQVLLHVC
jgi:hypothetical protein